MSSRGVLCGGPNMGSTVSPNISTNGVVKLPRFFVVDPSPVFWSWGPFISFQVGSCSSVVPLRGSSVTVDIVVGSVAVVRGIGTIAKAGDESTSIVDREVSALDVLVLEVPVLDVPVLEAPVLDVPGPKAPVSMLEDLLLSCFVLGVLVLNVSVS